MDKCPKCGTIETKAVTGAYNLDENSNLSPLPMKPNIYVKHEKGGSARMAICANCGTAYPSDEKVK